MTENLIQRSVLILVMTIGAILLGLPPDKRPEFLREHMAKLKVHYGLDLKGGAELRLQVPSVDPTGKPIDLRQAVQDALAVINKRIEDSKIVQDAEIRKQGEDVILIQLPGVSKTELEEIKNLITQLGSLELRIVAEIKPDKDPPKIFVLDDDGKKVTNPDGSFKTEPLTENLLNALYERKRQDPSYRAPAPLAFFPVRAEADLGDSQYKLVVMDPYNWTGDKFAQVGRTTDSRTLQPVPFFEIKGQLNRENFGKWTAAHVNYSMAIIYNGEIIAAPNIQTKLPGQGIITGMSDDEVTSLAKNLKSGSLAVKPKFISSSEVGPSLGKYTVDNGTKAIYIGFGLVIVFMMLYYWVSGIIASIALVLNLVILWGALNLFGATLTLPGIAGIILTVGMAVDANIIIFERIREEMAVGNSLAGAIEAGYERALTAIIDANVTTLITAAILYYYGSGAVKGFAVTLLLGILSSLFTALYVTRTCFGLLLRSGMLTGLPMLNLVGVPKLPLIQVRRIAMGISGVVVFAGVWLFAVQGERIYGIDLGGGMINEIALNNPDLTANEVRERISDPIFGAVVQKVLINDDPAMVTKHGPRQIKSKFSIRARNLPMGYFVVYHERIAKEVGSYLVDRNGGAEGGGAEWLEERKEQLLGSDTTSTQAIEFGELLRFVTYVEQAVESKLLSTEAHKTPKGYTDGLVLGGVSTEGGEDGGTGPVGDAEAAQRTRIKNYLQQIQSAQVSPDYFRFRLYQAFAKDLVHEGISEVSGSAGGFRAKLSLDRPYKEDVLRARLQSLNNKEGAREFADFNLRALGEPVEGHGHYDYLLNVGEQETNVGKVPSRLARIATDELLLSERFPTAEAIGGLVAKHQKQAAVTAVLLSLMAILAYLWLRFEWINGAAAVVCLAHDVLFTLGAIALFNSQQWIAVEINLPILAAFLTIIGYSLNDTIVVFDRIRENVEKEDTRDFEGLANRSVNQTLARTLLTSVTTMIAVVTLFIFNVGKGGVIEGFSFALIVGVAIGTYSSVFIATPILVEYHHREATAEAARKEKAAKDAQKEKEGGDKS